MQASGKVSLVKVEWQVGRYKEQLWAELDTGFSGGLVLPATRLGELISRLGNPDGFSWVELADSSQMQAPYYIGSVSPIDSGQHIFCHKSWAQGVVTFIRRQGNAPLTFCVKIKGGARQ
jgi:hypothetical protein